MKSLEINGKIREVTGKRDSKKLREQKLVPCVLYGEGNNIHFSVPFSEFRGLVYTPEVFLIHLQIEGKKYEAILQDTQWHPVDEQLVHADFLQIGDNKPIKVDLPVQIEGTARGIKAGGKLKVNLRKLKVKGLVKNLPDAIKVDVTELDLSDSIKVGDLQREGIQFLTSKSNVIATVSVTRAAKAVTAVKEETK